ncbi:MAG TPA: polysaccharide deacetylase family protein, partial [Bacillota bacterium]|nr:polysaccharide deacetylase family protein [Bacillota bacterium]
MPFNVIFGFDMETDIGSWTPFYEGLVKGTPRILELLAKHGITATFFFTGEAAQKNPQVVKDVAEAGHEVGCHSLHHETLGDKLFPIP